MEIITGIVLIVIAIIVGKFVLALALALLPLVILAFIGFLAAVFGLWQARRHHQPRLPLGIL